MSDKNAKEAWHTKGGKKGGDLDNWQITERDFKGCAASWRHLNIEPNRIVFLLTTEGLNEVLQDPSMPF